MRTIRLLLLAPFCFAASPLLYAQTHLTAAEAKGHIGEKATVCGSVVSTITRPEAKEIRPF